MLKNDHAIYNPLADLKLYFPSATIYPILIGQKIDPSSLDNLISQISNSCGFDCLLVASVDFSHYLPATLAQVHDSYTISNLQNLDSTSIQLSEVDSPQSLYFLIKYSLLKNAKSWHLFAHTNSGFLANNPDTETTTHIFGSYSVDFSPQNLVKTSTVSPATFNRSYGVNQFTIDPSSHFVISSITTPNETIKSVLPFKDNLFVRGPEKQQLIKNYFDSLPNDQFITKDYFWGRLIYDSKHNSSRP